MIEVRKSTRGYEEHCCTCLAVSSKLTVLSFILERDGGSSGQTIRVCRTCLLELRERISVYMRGFDDDYGGSGLMVGRKVEPY